MEYAFEHRIETLADNAVMTDDVLSTSFSVEGVVLSQWEFNNRDGWLGNAWLASAEISADTFDDAVHLFWPKLNNIATKIGFISQCYTEYRGQPYLITRHDLNLGYFLYTRARGSVPLMFTEAGHEALTRLLSDKSVADEFFHYWSDAVNAFGYSAKLLLMFAAIETLTRRANGKPDIEKRTEILGQELTDKIFLPNDGLRHRLTHGEYFGEPDSEIDYVGLLTSRQYRRQTER